MKRVGPSVALVACVASLTFLSGSVASAVEPVAPSATESASAPKARLRGKLWMTPLEHVECASELDIVRGDVLLLTGNGFAANEAIRITLAREEGDLEVASATAKEDGTLQQSVTVPENAVAGPGARLRATADMGETGVGLVLNSAPLRIFADAGDTDGDSVPDICDNCASVANEDLIDDDGDEIGDACDICPADRENDVDGDGLCADVDPDPWEAASGQ